MTFTENTVLNNRLIIWGIFVLLCLIWGSSFVLMKTGLEFLTAYQVAALRIISAGIVLMPYTLKAFKKIPPGKRFLVILSGLLGSFFPAFLFCIAETKIDSALAGVLNALTPLFTILTGVCFFKLDVPYYKYIGVAVGFTGLCLLFILGSEIDFTYISYSFLVLLATLFYGINVNIVVKHLRDIDSLHIAALAFSFLVIPSAITLWLTGYFDKNLLNTHILRSTFAGIVLGVFGTALASVLFYMLVKRAGAIFASAVTYGIPFVAVFWGLVRGESLNKLQVICLGIILSGVYLTTKPIKAKQLAT